MYEFPYNNLTVLIFHSLQCHEVTVPAEANPDWIKVGTTVDEEQH